MAAAASGARPDVRARRTGETRVPAALLPIWAVLGVVLGAAVAVKTSLGVPWHHVMGDPASTLGAPFWVGFVSNVGAMLWTAAAAIFLVGHRIGSGAAHGRGRFLLASALLTALLGVDDLFLLHEQVFPDLLGIPQAAVLATYATLAGAYAWAYRRALAPAACILPLLAAGLLGASMGLDQLIDGFDFQAPGSGFLEDACKLLGIGAWLAYAWTVATRPAPTR